jgi:hypothetical protein
MVIKRVGVMSVGKIYGVMCAAIGLLLGLVMAAAGSIGAGLASASGSSALPFAGFGVAAIVVFPILYGIFGFIGGLISGALYNVFAGMVGGVEIETT